MVTLSCPFDTVSLSFFLFSGGNPVVIRILVTLRVPVVRLQGTYAVFVGSLPRTAQLGCTHCMLSMQREFKTITYVLSGLKPRIESERGRRRLGRRCRPAYLVTVLTVVAAWGNCF